jgi:hypothetical protein
MTEPIQDPKKRFLCRHIHTAGHRCGSPALRGEQFCFYHHTTRRPAPSYTGAHPNRCEFDIPSLEDRAGIQHTVARILCFIATNQLDPKRAGLLLYGLQIASTNLPREPRIVSSTSRESASQSQPSALIEDIILDEAHGLLAPIAEILPPEIKPNRIAAMLESIRNRTYCPKCNSPIIPVKTPATVCPEPGNDQPTILPNFPAAPTASAVIPAKPESAVIPNKLESPVIPAQPESLHCSILPTLQATAESQLQPAQHHPRPTPVILNAVKDPRIGFLRHQSIPRAVGSSRIRGHLIQPHHPATNEQQKRNPHPARREGWGINRTLPFLQPYGFAGAAAFFPAIAAFGFQKGSALIHSSCG